MAATAISVLICSHIMNIFPAVKSRDMMAAPYARIQSVRLIGRRRKRLQRPRHRQAPHGGGQGRHRARDRRQPVRDAAEGHRGRRAGDSRRPQPVRPVARHHGVPQSRGGVRESRVRVVGDRRSRRGGARGEELRAALLRGVSERRRRRADLQPALPHLSAERVPAQRARRAVRAEGVERLPPESGRRAAVPGERQVAARDLPEQPAQSDGRRRDIGRSERARRSRSRQGRRGVQRRALRPHGLARPPPFAARGARHARDRPSLPTRSASRSA